MCDRKNLSEPLEKVVNARFIKSLTTVNKSVEFEGAAVISMKI